MSDQFDLDIFFTFTKARRNVRFLELPAGCPGSDWKGESTHLCLKSGVPGDKNSQSTSNAVLCTEHKTYQIRQVQASNSIFVVQPSEVDHDQESDNLPLSGMTTTSSCSTTLELIPSSSSGFELLSERLPLYDDGEVEKATEEPIQDGCTPLKHKIFEDIPLSVGELEEAWRDLCAFEHANRVWRPAATLLLKTWRSILSAVFLNGFDATGLLPNSLLKDAAEEHSLPPSLPFAIRALLNQNKNAPDDDFELDRSLCLAWTGEILLKAQSRDRHPIAATEFLEEWKDLLPKPWKSDASLEVLKGKFTQPTRSTIRVKDLPSSGAPDPKAATDTKRAIASRNWHEKFKGSRRQ